MKTYLFFFVLAMSSRVQAFHVMIDAGHGGTDRGAVRGNLQESEIVLSVAKLLKERLRAEPGLQVSMTRESDTSLELRDRVHHAEKVGADLFVSLHANANVEQKPRGIELFFQNSLPPDEDAMYLANIENNSENADLHASTDPTRKGDLAAIIEDLHRQSRILSSLKVSNLLAETMSEKGQKSPSVKQAPLYVVSKTSMPSVLVELGFLSNPQEGQRLSERGYQSQLATKIKEAILRYRAEMSGPADYRVD